MIARIYLTFLLLLSFSAGRAQENNTNVTLDDYFAGVPLKEDFVKWFYYVRQHPFLGIDSTGTRGFYSSFKPGIDNYFPFPDSLPVKLLLKKTIFRDSISNDAYDSVAIVMIEGIFTNDKIGRKKSREVFKEIRKELRRHYRQADPSSDGSGSWFKKGKSQNFPDCSIWMGYEDVKKFYYVLIAYEFPVRTEQPWYLQLAS